MSGLGSIIVQSSGPLDSISGVMAPGTYKCKSVALGVDGFSGFDRGAYSRSQKVGT